MAEETNAPVVADASKPTEEPTPSTDAIAEPAVAEAKPGEDGVIATEGVAEGKYLATTSCTKEANAVINQFPRQRRPRKSLPRKKRPLPARSQRLLRPVMTQVSQNHASLTTSRLRLLATVCLVHMLTLLCRRRPGFRRALHQRYTCG
jgi:hypothetical protein